MIRSAPFALSVLLAGCLGTAGLMGEDDAGSGGGSALGGGAATGGGVATGGGAATGGGSTTGGGAAAGGGVATGGGASATGGGAATGGGTASGGGAANPCMGFNCPSGSHCEPNPTRCVCNPGFFADAGTCFAANPGIPEQRTEAQVCAGYKAGMVITTPNAFTKSTMTCDPGVLARGGIDDTLARLNMLRWLSGLGPVTDSASGNDQAQKCALISAWNPAGVQAHNPPSTATCYSPEGAAGAGSSNIAWGNGTAPNAIDQWYVDNGNFTTFGHRRWLMNPPLGPVGIGHYVGGNNYGSAACIQVFGSSGGGPAPSWYAFPPPGFVPAPVVGWTWTVHGSGLRFTNLDAGVTRMGDGMQMPVDVEIMQGGYGQPAIALFRTGNWQPVVGQVYRVQVTATGATPIDYEIKPVNCP